MTYELREWVMDKKVNVKNVLTCLSYGTSQNGIVDALSRSSCDLSSIFCFFASSPSLFSCDSCLRFFTNGSGAGLAIYWQEVYHHMKNILSSSVTHKIIVISTIIQNNTSLLHLMSYFSTHSHLMLSEHSVCLPLNGNTRTPSNYPLLVASLCLNLILIFHSKASLVPEI